MSDEPRSHDEHDPEDLYQPGFHDHVLTSLQRIEDLLHDLIELSQRTIELTQRVAGRSLREPR